MVVCLPGKWKALGSSPSARKKKDEGKKKEREKEGREAKEEGGRDRDGREREWEKERGGKEGRKGLKENNAMLRQIWQDRTAK